MLTEPVLRPVLEVAMRQSMPTNVAMLLLRTANRSFGNPNANKDWVAPLFLEAIVPKDAAQIRGGGPTLYAYFRRMLMEMPGVGVPGMLSFLDGRTQWFDDRVTRALDRGVIQVVVLAAGFDSTAYRLGRPGVRFFEIDLPEASRRKQQLVAACLPDEERHPRPAFVAADLGEVDLGEALEGTGFDPSKPTFFSAQGLLYYIPSAAVGGLLCGIRAVSAPGSSFAFDYLRSDCLSGKRLTGGLEVMRLVVEARGEPFVSAIDDAGCRVPALARLFGFQCSDQLGAKQLAGRFLPHLQWHEWPAAVQPCFSYAEFAVPSA